MAVAPPMRALGVVLAVAATIALAGCSSEPNSPVDPETTDADDYEVPLLLLGIAVIVGVVLLAVNLSTANSGGAAPPEAPVEPAWQPAEEQPAEDAPARASRRPARTAPAAPPRRRRAP